MQQTKRLYRSRELRMVAGVCGGLAEYLRTDVVVVRLLFVLLGLTGIGVVGYIAAWLIMPESSGEVTLPQQLPLQPVEEESATGDAKDSAIAASGEGEKRLVDKKLYRSRTQRILGGVCGGLAEYFEVDVVIVRLVLLLLLFANAPAVVGYLIAWIIIPERAHSAQGAQAAAEGEAVVEDEAVRRSGAMWLGYLLLGLGGFLLLRQWMPYAWRMTGFWPFRQLMISWWPLVLVGLGIAFLISGRGRSSSS